MRFLLLVALLFRLAPVPPGSEHCAAERAVAAVAAHHHGAGPAADCIGGEAAGTLRRGDLAGRSGRMLRREFHRGLFPGALRRRASPGPIRLYHGRRPAVAGLQMPGA